MTDLVARVDAIAAKAREKTDPRQVVLEQCPELVAWLKEWQTASGAKATLLRAWADDKEIYRA